MKKNKHSNPMEYRIIYRAGMSIMRSKQYYNVFHSSEALADIYHTFHAGKIHSKSITIYKIQEWDRFNEKWVDRLEKAIETIDRERLDHGEIVPILSRLNQSKKIILKKGGKK